MNILMEKLRAGYRPNELYCAILEIEDRDLHQIDEFMPYVPPKLLEIALFYQKVRLSLKNSDIFIEYPQLFNAGSIIATIPVMKLFFKRNPARFKAVRKVISDNISKKLDHALADETKEFTDEDDIPDTLADIHTHSFEEIHAHMNRALDAVCNNRFDDVQPELDAAISIEVNDIGRYHSPNWVYFERLINSFATFVKATNPHPKKT